MWNVGAVVGTRPTTGIGGTQTQPPPMTPGQAGNGNGQIDGKPLTAKSFSPTTVNYSDMSQPSPVRSESVYRPDTNSIATTGTLTQPNATITSTAQQTPMYSHNQPLVAKVVGPYTPGTPATGTGLLGTGPPPVDPLYTGPRDENGNEIQDTGATTTGLMSQAGVPMSSADLIANRQKMADWVTRTSGTTLQQQQQWRGQTGPSGTAVEY